MRGSVYYQSAELAKVIFQEGAKKYEKIDPAHPYYQKVSSYKTMESYRNVWNNFFNYLAEHWKIKDCEKIEVQHVFAYMDYKLEYYPSKQYLQKISAAIGKLEIALRKYSKQKYGVEKQYDFSQRQCLLDEAIDLNLVANSYRNRAYDIPEKIIAYLQTFQHQLAASIELEGGARIEGCSLIKKDQLLGYSIDTISQQQKGVLFTKEKGGKEGKVYISTKTYDRLEKYIMKYGIFKIKRQAYFKDIREACQQLDITAEGTHGFRWNFAQRRLSEYAQAGYTYEQSIQGVSWEMKHNRASITEHYIS
jgi:integrase